jgi:abortive infection bacteriophage resistance protein
MKNNFINILFILWFILIIFFLFQQINMTEGFTPKIRSLYNPYIRNFRIYIESFSNDYNDNYIIKRLKNIGIY